MFVASDIRESLELWRIHLDVNEARRMIREDLPEHDREVWEFVRRFYSARPRDLTS